MRRLTSSVPEIKLSIVHIPTKGERISEGLKKHHVNKRKQKAQVQLTRQQAQRLANKWNAKYIIKEGV